MLCLGFSCASSRTHPSSSSVLPRESQRFLVRRNRPQISRREVSSRHSSGEHHIHGLSNVWANITPLVLIYLGLIGFVVDSVTLGRLLGGIHNPQHEVDHHRDQQQDGQRRGPEPVVEAGLTPHPDGLRSPVIGP